jgi:hypothetical protein
MAWHALIESLDDLLERLNLFWRSRERSRQARSHASSFSMRVSGLQKL